MALPPNELTIFPFGAGTDGGLLPFVGPFASTDLEIDPSVVPAQAGVSSTLTYGLVDMQAPIDWVSQEQSLRPSDIPPDAWDAIFANFSQAMGPTPAVMQQVMFNDSLYLYQLGENVTSADQLMGFELMKAEDALPAPTLSVAVDDSLPAPGLPLTFQRTYDQSLEGRIAWARSGEGGSRTGTSRPQPTRRAM